MCADILQSNSPDSLSQFRVRRSKLKIHQDDWMVNDIDCISQTNLVPVTVFLVLDLWRNISILIRLKTTVKKYEMLGISIYSNRTIHYQCYTVITVDCNTHTESEPHNSSDWAWSCPAKAVLVLLCVIESSCLQASLSAGRYQYFLTVSCYTDTSWLSWFVDLL